MKRNASLTILMIAAVVLVQGCASSHQPMVFEPGQLDASSYVRKVDQFVVIVDGSGSMGYRNSGYGKMQTAEDFLISLNQTIPDLGFKGALRTFGRGLCGSKGKTVSIVDFGEHDGTAFDQGIERYDCARGHSPLDRALQAVVTDMPDHQARSVVVIVSDGYQMNEKELAAASVLKNAFGEKIDIYAVQIGNEINGSRLLGEVVSAGGDGYVEQVGTLTSAAAMSQFVIDAFLWADNDSDGVPNHLDKCPGTPKGVEVDGKGCPIDSDGDGVPDHVDRCPATPAGVAVDAHGCELDSDGDGVPNSVDKCPGTPAGVTVDARGCAVDSDGDGVPDYLDECENTPRGVPVAKNGCPLRGIEVSGDEWSVRGAVLFDLNRATIRPEAAEVLLKIAAFLRDNQQYAVEIQGNTDSTGPAAWNMTLSQMRADAVRDHLVENGIAPDRLTAKAYGPREPLESNATADGRAANRRVDFKPTSK